MTRSPDEVPDPRRFADPRDTTPQAARLHAIAASSLAGETAQVADRAEVSLVRELASLLASGDAEALADVLQSAPGVAVHRHLVRALAEAARGHAQELTVTLFAIPLVIVAALTNRESVAMRIPGVIADTAALHELLRQHRALGGNETFALGNALIGGEAIGVRQLPALLAAGQLAEGRRALALPPAPIEVVADERAHLRFLVGSAVVAPGIDVVARDGTGWMMPLARALIAQLSPPGVSMVALPRRPAAIALALGQGLAAQRDVSAQLFASNALRSLRAEAGEPTAIVSAHEAADAPGGGELRLSLSAPLAPRSAQGFRCPVYASERVVDVVTMLVDLMRDCRVADVRLVRGVHADRDPLTGGPLLFKPETLPPQAVH